MSQTKTSKKVIASNEPLAELKNALEMINHSSVCDLFMKNWL